MADYCVYWFRRAHDHLPDCTAATRRRPRGTRRHAEHPQQPIPRRRPRSRRARPARSSKPSITSRGAGEANVHVSIANWVKTQDAALLPKSASSGSKSSRPRRRRNCGKQRAMVGGQRIRTGCPRSAPINSALSDQTDVGGAQVLTCNTEPQARLQGPVPGHEGFVLEPEEAAARTDRARPDANREVIHPLLDRREMLVRRRTPNGWVIDFRDSDILRCAGVYQQPSHASKDTFFRTARRRRKKESRRRQDCGAQDQQFLRRWWQLVSAPQN